METRDNRNVTYIYSPGGYILVNTSGNTTGLDMGCESVGFTLADYIKQCPRYDSITPKNIATRSNYSGNTAMSSPYCISSQIDRVRSTKVKPSKNYDIGIRYTYDKNIRRSSGP
eukprot:gnl/Chilomastix_caulleri/2557.p1 GENE.gnl/Chilomastix_caulleri/2557~~gnl/Chilomastix_caulleri/2557.p1  ORF type:complete len:114 (+),score=14.25 gnl/Chilomastix_caulleri/2557:39-380(+)